MMGRHSDMRDFTAKMGLGRKCEPPATEPPAKEPPNVRAEAAERENARLRKALAPFAAEADARKNLALGEDIDHWPIGGSRLTLGDLRRARAALQDTKTATGMET